AAALLVLVLPTAPVAQEPVESPGFFNDLQDVPLMPGLSEMLDRSLVFDKPEGRIVETTASADTAPEAIRAFYERTLPQLGWTQVTRESFIRQDEELTMQVAREGGFSVVRFLVEPR